MSSQPGFCYRWKRGYCEPSEPMTLEAAHAAHASGDTYTVLFPDGAHVRVAVEVSLGVDVVSVLFLDERSRLHSEYVFARPEAGRLFLEQVFRQTLAEDDRYGNRPIASQTVRSRPTGEVYTARGPNTGPTERTKAMLSQAALAVLWEPIPEWGDWSGYARLERDKPNPDPAAYRL